jgi:cyanophycin synthetase
VLNAEDPLVVPMARACRGEVIWFSDAPSNALIDRHCANGGRAVVLEDVQGRETVVVRHGRRRLPVTAVPAMPSAFKGAARMNVKNALAATGAALGLGIHVQHVRVGLRTFTTSLELAPGRLNVTCVDGVHLVLDYGHNPEAVRAVGEFAQGYAKQIAETTNATPRLIAVVSTAGDRRDEDMRALGQVAAMQFDTVVVKEDENLRGRASGDVPRVIAAAIQDRMQAGKARCTEVLCIPNERAAVDAALSKARPDDVVVAFVDKAEDYWPNLTRA